MGGGETFFVQLSLSLPKGVAEEEAVSALEAALPEFMIDQIDEETD